MKTRKKRTHVRFTKLSDTSDNKLFSPFSPPENLANIRFSGYPWMNPAYLSTDLSTLCGKNYVNIIPLHNSELSTATCELCEYLPAESFHNQQMLFPQWCARSHCGKFLRRECPVYVRKHRRSTDHSADAGTFVTESMPPGHSTEKKCQLHPSGM